MNADQIKDFEKVYNSLNKEISLDEMRRYTDAIIKISNELGMSVQEAINNFKRNIDKRV